MDSWQQEADALCPDRGRVASSPAGGPGSVAGHSAGQQTGPAAWGSTNSAGLEPSAPLICSSGLRGPGSTEPYFLGFVRYLSLLHRR